MNTPNYPLYQKVSYLPNKLKKKIFIRTEV